jgi:hypothetical protein
MATTHTKTCTERLVMPDGRIRLTEETNFFIDDVLQSGRKDHRFIEVGDDVSGEDQIVKDIVNGNLHTPARKSARDAVIAAQAAQAG